MSDGRRDRMGLYGHFAFPPQCPLCGDIRRRDRPKPSIPLVQLQSMTDRAVHWPAQRHHRVLPTYETDRTAEVQRRQLPIGGVWCREWLPVLEVLGELRDAVELRWGKRTDVRHRWCCCRGGRSSTEWVAHHCFFSMYQCGAQACSCQCGEFGEDGGVVVDECS